MWARAAVTCNQRCCLLWSCCSDTKAGRDYKGRNFSKHVWPLSRCAAAPPRRFQSRRAFVRASWELRQPNAPLEKKRLRFKGVIMQPACSDSHGRK